MSEQVRAAILEGPDHITMRRYAMPELAEDSGVLEVEMAGICHTDVGLFHGTVTYAPYPVMLGHEILGRIHEIGPVAQKRWGVNKGDRVVVEAMVRCGYCRHCIDGDYKFCEAGIGYGTTVSAAVAPHLWGSYSEFMYLAPGTQVYKIPDAMPAARAILINVAFANAIQWTVLKGGLRLGDRVVVQGVGPIGLACVAVAREAGASQIIATGRSSDRGRLDLARRFSADAVVDVDQQDVVKEVRRLTDGKMADVVVDVTGSGAAVVNSIEMVRPSGTVVNAGVTGDKTQTPIILDRLLYREVRLIGVFTSSSEAMRRAIDFDHDHKYPFEDLVTDNFPLEKAEQAVRAAGRELENPNTIKVTITPN
jgi:alcohol dehydrogenase